MTSLRRGRWKLVKFLNAAPELYNLSADPGEAVNLASERPGLTAALMEILRGARTEHAEFPLEPMKRRP